MKVLEVWEFGAGSGHLHTRRPEASADCLALGHEGSLCVAALETDDFRNGLIEGPLGRATPPPFNFWIGTQVQIGERKHAMPNRRLQEDDFMMKCIRQIVQVWLFLRMCAM